MKHKALKFRSIPKGELSDSFIIIPCIIGLLFMLYSVIEDRISIDIEKFWPRTEMTFTGVVDSKTNHDPTEKVCQQCQVKWNFECQTEIGYWLKEKEKFGNKWLVSINVDHAKIKLFLPMEVAMPTNSPRHVEKHLEGHVAICKKVYEDAEKHMQNAVRMAMRRTYSGEGETVDEAGAQATKTATFEIMEDYRKHSYDVVEDVTDIYDLLQLKESADPRQSVLEAFEIYKSGKPRRLSSL